MPLYTTMIVRQSVWSRHKLGVWITCRIPHFDDCFLKRPIQIQISVKFLWPGLAWNLNYVQISQHTVKGVKIPSNTRVEQDTLDLVHSDVLVSLLVSKILIINVLFVTPFQDLYFKNVDLVLFQAIHLKILVFSTRYQSTYVICYSNQRNIQWVKWKLQKLF